MVDSDVGEGMEKVAVVHWLQGSSSVVSLEAAEVMEKADEAAGLATVRVFGGCGEEQKGGLQQPLGVLASGSRRPQQLTLNASFNKW